MMRLHRISSMATCGLAVLLCNYLSFSFVLAAPDRSWQTWGPYRPNLYFGVRPQIPESLLAGLMWADGTDETRMLNTIRDTCEQDEGMEYGWTMFDARVGGSQVIRDKELYVDLSIDFMKTEDGKSWAVRVAGVPRSDAPGNLRTAVIFHAALEGAAHQGSRDITCYNDAQVLNGVGVMCTGDITDLGEFSLQALGDASNKVLQDTVVKSVQVSEDNIWQAKSVFQDQLKTAKNIQSDGVGNMHFIQTIFEGAFTITFLFQNSESDLFTTDAIDKRINVLNSSFPANVERVFPRTSPFGDEKYRELSHYLMSNLLGGMGFFYGDSKADFTHAPEYDETEPNFWEAAAEAMARASITTTNATSLLSFIPSRPFFPRGFLWDEGFHLLPVVEWDLDLAVSVLQSWLALMDEDGWIGREQILGPEARSKVPSKYQTQYPHFANPPTLSLLLPILISKLTNPSTYVGHESKYLSSREEALTALKQLYPLLSRHYQWFRRTQSGDFKSDYPRPKDAINGEGYRWRGRTPDHTLTSGLDDYPRANPPHPSELHIDALAWVGASARALQKVAEYLGEDSDALMYKQQVKDVKHNLDVIHWDDTEKAYCDATTTADTDNVPIFKRICHLGYISLFPLLLGLMDANHPHLSATLDLLSDPSKLWSSHGIRSLSKADHNYGSGENYWRGAVWMNINVLATLRLHELGLEGLGDEDTPLEVQARALSLAGDLRKALVTTVYNSWEKTGFAWEQYNDETGQGSHSRAFTGWTACVILLMGLGNPEHTDDGVSDNPATITSSFGVSIVMIIIVFILVVVFRRRLVGGAKRVIWNLQRNQWERRGYEHVIDLDGYGSVR